MARKNLLAGLLDEPVQQPGEPIASEELTAVNFSRGRPASAETLASVGGRGAVGAMGRSLELLTAEVAAARSVEAQLLSGASIIEIDPALVDPSPVPDRMPVDAEAQAAFVAAIRDHGQQVPILVRPHPAVDGRYQVAFGHRRLRAAVALGRPVRACVRRLTDDELVIAQGQENNARQDLTFIERASFAACLESRGVKRETIMAALLVDKTELSRLIAVRRAVPDIVVTVIGPAPKAGRRRWMALAEQVAAIDPGPLVQRLLAEATFSVASSDERFVHLRSALSPRPVQTQRGAETWTAPDGHKVARVERGETRVTLTIDERLAPAFGEYVFSRFGELYEAFRREQSSKESLT
jgi:ParB family chromosome partitioning protein